MFKPGLKRSRQELNIESNSKLYPDLYKPYRPSHSFSTRQRQKTVSQLPRPCNSIPLSILPRKILQESPKGFYVPKQKLTAPLSSHFYQYPENIRKEFAKSDADMLQRGIGHYDNIFWFYRNQKLIFWHYLQNSETRDSLAGKKVTSYKTATKIVEWKFDCPVFGVAVGKLHNVSATFQKDEVILVAVAFSSLIHLFVLDDIYSLRMRSLEISIRTQRSQTAQKMIITDNNELFFGGSNRLLTMMSFKSPGNIKKVTPLSFSQKFIRSVTFKSHRNIENIQQIITTKDRVYCLVRKTQKTSWPWILGISTKVKNWFTGKQAFPDSHSVIDVYALGQNNSMRFLHSIEQAQMTFKIKSNYADLSGRNIGRMVNNAMPIDKFSLEKGGMNIKSIYIDKETQLLGVVLQSGYFLLIKDTQHIGFWKQPCRIPRVPETVGLDIPYYPKADTKELMESEAYQYEVLTSKGYNNLTLLKNMLAYIDDTHFYLLKCRDKHGQIWQVNKSPQVNSQRKFPLMQTHRQWIIFQKAGFQIITKPQPRDIILSYLSSTEIERQQLIKSRRGGKPYLINMKIDELAHLYGYSQFCSYLLELLMIKDYQVRLNRQFEEFIKIDIFEKGRRIKYQEWYTLDIYREDHQDRVYHITSQVQETIWRHLIEYQSHQIRLSPQVIEQRGQLHSENTNAMWFAIRFILYKCLQNILQWTPISFTTFPSSVKLTIIRLQRLKHILIEREQKMFFNGGEHSLSYPNYRRDRTQMINQGQMYTKNQMQENINANQYNKNTSLSGTANTMASNSNISDTVIQFVFPNINGNQETIFTTTSTAKLSQMVIEAIPKILQLIEVYEYLGETEKLQKEQPNKIRLGLQHSQSGYEDYSNSKETLPRFVQVLFNNPSRKRLKETMLKFLDGPQSKQAMLQKIQINVPQLQIGLDLTYKNWKEKHMMKIRPEDVDLTKLAVIVTSTDYLPELKTYFKDSPDRYIHLLIEKIREYRRQDYELKRRAEIYSDNNYFEREEKKLFDQNRYALQLDIMKYEDLIKNFLIQTIDSQIVTVQSYEKTSTVLYSSPHTDFQAEQRQKRRKMLQNILRLVAKECSEDLKRHCEELLRNKKLFDALHYFKQNVPVVEYADQQPYLASLRRRNKQQRGEGLSRYCEGNKGFRRNIRQKRIEEMDLFQAAEYIKTKQKINKYGSSFFLDFLQRQDNQESYNQTSKNIRSKNPQNKPSSTSAIQEEFAMQNQFERNEPPPTENIPESNRSTQGSFMGRYF